MSDFSDFMEMMGLDPADPEAIDNLLMQIHEADCNEIYTPDGNLCVDDVIPLTQCDDPSECADCDGECELGGLD